jgi:hypothetical protein
VAEVEAEAALVEVEWEDHTLQAPAELVSVRVVETQ